MSSKYVLFCIVLYQEYIQTSVCYCTISCKNIILYLVYVKGKNAHLWIKMLHLIVTFWELLKKPIIDVTTGFMSVVN